MLIQPKDIFKALQVKDKDEALRILSVAYTFLAYLKVGDALEVSSMEFSKIANDLIHLKINLSEEELLNTLEQFGVIKLPV
jgi:hypothetical protein